MKHIVFGKPPIGREEINFVTKVIKSKWMGSGQITQDFENKFRKFKNSKYAISTNSCTSALYLALKYSGVKPGDEVITHSILTLLKLKKRSQKKQKLC